MKFTITLFLAILFFSGGYSQQTFQDGSGNTNISLGPDIRSLGFVYYNTTDKSVVLGYNYKGFGDTSIVGGYDIPSFKADLLLGADIKVKTKDGIGNVFKGGTINPGVTLGTSIGLFKDDFFKKGHYNTVFLRPQISYSQYDVINVGSNDFIMSDIKRWEFSCLLNYNVQFNLSRTNKNKNGDRRSLSYIFLYLQSGYKRANNFDDLDDAQITTTIANNIERSIQTSQTGKLGPFISSNTLPLNVDLAWTPSLFTGNYIGFNLYYRTNFFKEINTSYGGVGLYLADPDEPSKISGGIGWQFNDIYDRLKKDTNMLDRSSVFFYVGYAIRSK